MLIQPLHFAKVKSQIFIDNLVVELAEGNSPTLRAILKDEQGSICSALETNVLQNQQIVIWKGLNDLPYGIYTLELFNGANEMKTRMIKRV